MSLQKSLMRYLGLGTIVSGVILLLTHFLPPIPLTIPLVTGHETFWENVILGVFGGIITGFISSVIIYILEKEKACLTLVRKVKFLDSSIRTYINKGEAFVESNQRYDNIKSNLQSAKDNEDTDKVKMLLAELAHEENNRKVLKFLAQEQVETWNMIGLKANEIKEDYTFKDILTEKNKDHIDEAIKYLSYIEQEAPRIKSILRSATGEQMAGMANFEIKCSLAATNFCVEEIIEACYNGKKQQRLKQKYLSADISEEAKKILAIGLSYV